MPELAYSPVLGRRLRRDQISKLGNRTEDWLIELIRERDDPSAIEVAKYLLEETQLMVEYDVEVRSALWTWIADHLGEEALHATIREIADLDKWQQEHMAKRHRTTRTMTAEEYARLHEAEHKRALRYHFTISEEPDRYVMVFDPCMGGRVRRLRDENGQPPACAGRTRKAYPWSWGKAGIPYACVRIAIAERLHIEKRGYPWMVTECPADDDFAPCVRYLYQNPADIPARYFEMAGFTRDASRITPAVDPPSSSPPRAEQGRVARLEYSEALGRRVRSEDWKELGVFTERKIQEAIRARDYDLAIELTDYLDEKNWVNVIHHPEIISATLTVLAKKAGEDAVGRALRWVPGSTGTHPERYRGAMTVDDYVAYVAEQRRALQYDFHVVEEPDRFVFVLEHCNTGGRMARLRNEAGERYPAIGRTSRPYPWSWGRADVPYYCCMQAVFQEIAPIERTGSPDLITDCAGGEGPCRQYVYKAPDLVPEDFYIRVGCSKRPSLV